QPCSLINQLKHHIEHTILAAGKEFKIAKIPLKGSNLSYLDSNRMTSWSDVMNNDSLADRVSAFRTYNYWTKFLKQTTDKDMARLQPLAPVLNTSLKPAKTGDGRKQTMATRHLYHFLMNPVKQSAQSHLGLYAREASIEDLALKEDEPFFSVFPVDYNIKMSCLRLWLDLNFDPTSKSLPIQREPEAILERIYADYEKQSATPEGVYAELDRQTMLKTIQKTIETLGVLLEEIHFASMYYRAIFWGILEENGDYHFQAEPRLILPAIEITTGCLGPHGGQQQFQAEIHAALNWVWQDGDGMWHTIVLTGSKKDSPNPNRHLLKPLLAYIVGVSQQHPDLPLNTYPIQFHLVYDEKVRTFQSHLNQTEATFCLKNLLEAFGNQKEFHWLPFETVLKCKNGPHRIKTESFSNDQREAFCEEINTFFDEVDDYLVKRLAAPITPDILDIANKRFQWIFKMIESVA
ncbi:MAG: hypothetical protein PVI90_12985, partial [Desulfobacteraceae bacterium]